MKTLSIRPPWAYMIIYGIPYGVEVKNPDGSSRVEDSGKVILKNMENRNRPLPKNFELPQRICVHCSTREDPIEEALELFHKLGLPYGSAMVMYSNKLPRGAIIGEVTIMGQVTESENPWFTGRYGYLLKDPVPYREPVPCRGMLGFFEPDSPTYAYGKVDIRPQRVFKGDRWTRIMGSRIPHGSVVRVVKFCPRRTAIVEYNGERIITKLWCLAK